VQQTTERATKTYRKRVFAQSKRPFGKATARNEKYHKILKEQQQHRKTTQIPKMSNKLRNEMTARNIKAETILNKPQQKQTQIPSIKTPNKQQTLNENLLYFLQDFGVINSELSDLI
jgi:hypothetical protein